MVRLTYFVVVVVVVTCGGRGDNKRVRRCVGLRLSMAASVVLETMAVVAFVAV